MLPRIFIIRFAVACITALSTAATARAQFVYAEVQGVAMVSGYHGPETHVVIPPTINGLPVHSITTYFKLGPHVTDLTIPESVVGIQTGPAFRDCKGLLRIHVDPQNPSYVSEDGVLFDKWKTTLRDFPCARAGSYTVPDGVTTIDNSAFERTELLESVTLPDSVRSINSDAFSRCSRLSNITLGRSVRSIHSGAFVATPITEIFLPQNVSSVSVSAFSACASLGRITVDPANQFFSSNDGILYNRPQTTLILCPPKARSGSVIVHDGVNQIGTYAFKGCREITRLTLQAPLARIEHAAFAECSALQQVDLPDSLYAIGSSAFFNCASLQSVTIPPNITELDSTFDGCASLTSVTLNSRLLSMWGTFFGCARLQSIHLPDSLTSIGPNTFYGCSSLRTVTVPRNVNQVPGDFADDCPQLADILVDSANTWFASVDGILFNKSLTQLIRVPEAKNVGNYEVPHGVGSLGRHALYGVRGLTAISLPKSTTSLANRIFDYCPKLASIVAHAENPSFASIDGVLFAKDLKQLLRYPQARVGPYTIPESVESLDWTAFYDSKGLTSVTLSTRVTLVPVTFAFCENLQEFIVPPANPHYKTIDGVLFQGVGGALVRFPAGRGPNYRIPAGTSAIDGDAFSGSPKLHSVVIPSSVSVVQVTAFGSCPNLDTVVFEGNHPAVLHRDAFDFYRRPSVYYLPGATGWEQTPLERPPILWNPQFVLADPSTALSQNGFAFVAGASNGVKVAVEAANDIANPIWEEIGAISFTGEPVTFHDPQRTLHPTRFYRFRSP